MAIPAWYWPASGASARGCSIVPLGAGFAIPDWTTPTLWQFSSVSGQFINPINLASSTPGLAAVCPDVASGIWSVSWGGQIWRVLSGGSISATGQLPSGSVYVGCATVGPIPYFLSAPGTVYSSGGTAIGTFPSNAWFLQSSGSTLFSLLPASGIGTMTTGGVTGRVALPSGISNPLTMNVINNDVALGGWQAAASLPGGAAAQLDPQNAQTLAVAGSGTLSLWSAPSLYSEAWAVSQTLSGLANLNALSWLPNGTQILTTSPGSGVIQAINFTLGQLSLAQNIPASAPFSVVVAGDNAHALVAQSGSPQLVNLVLSGGIWTPGVPIVLPNPVQGLTLVSSGQAATINGSNLSYLNLATGGWVISNSVALNFTPSVINSDVFGSVYAAGSGQLVVASGFTITGYGSWSGSTPTALLTDQGRILLTVPSDNTLYIFGQSNVPQGANTSPATFVLENSQPLALGSQVGLARATSQIFVLGSGATTQYGFSGKPYVLTPVMSGAVAQWNGSSWIQTPLGIGHAPSALGFDASGNLVVATVQNTLWTISPSGSVVSSGIVPTYSGQTQITPLGVAALMSFGGHLYAATSMPGTLIQLE